MEIVRYLRPHLPLGPTFPGGPYQPGRDYLLTQELADHPMIRSLIKTGMAIVITNDFSEEEEKKSLEAKAKEIEEKTAELNARLDELKEREASAAKVTSSPPKAATPVEKPKAAKDMKKLEIPKL